VVDDWLNIALRFALYANMATPFGVAAFGVYALHESERSSPIARRFRAVIGCAAAISIVLSLLSMAVLAKTMSGAQSYGELSSDIFSMMLTGTHMGVAWIVRIFALAACVVLATTKRNMTSRFVGLTTASGIALATLAWSGHGAMDDGVRGYMHLTADIAHLWAAGTWSGALLAFLMLSAIKPDDTRSSIEILSRTSNGFARIGTVIVATLTLSGAVNYVLIAGPSLSPIVTTFYGRLLLGKLALLAGMLVLAAANRYRLSPRLEAALATGGEHAEAVEILRRSLFAEIALAVVVLACVAWLGILDPAAP